MKTKYAVVFYNVENLFDVIDDPEVNDNEYLPSSPKFWSNRKYKRKLKNIAFVIRNLHEETNNIPFLIGLAEIENAKVLQDLVNHDEVKDFSLDYIHFDSKDARGIDVALLYNSLQFRVIASKIFKIDYEKSELKEPTRDILYVKGDFNNHEIHVLVNHWPSRREGVKETAFKRMAASKTVSQILKDIYVVDPKAFIVVMGDFNDNPNNESITSLIHSASLSNPVAKLWSWSTGTLMHQKKWFLFDQILISKHFLKSDVFDLDSAEIYKPQFLRVEKGKFKGAPKRSFIGNKHLSGYSDHFPVFLSMNSD